MKSTWLVLSQFVVAALSMGQSPVSLENAEHYTWGDHCDGWYLMKSPALHIIQERMPPGTAETMHHHKLARQFFYVLRGVATMEHEGAVTQIREGQGIEIAPGVAHRIKNDSKQVLEIIVTSQPPSHGDRVEAELPGR